MDESNKTQISRREFFIKTGIIAATTSLGSIGFQNSFAKGTPELSNLKIYCAGPLFNDGERATMLKIATTMEKYGFKTYLPQRDGFEFAKLDPVLKKAGVPEKEVQDVLNKIIFSFDIYNLLKCNATIFNMDGRVPDGGSIVEATTTWSCGHPLVIYKDDPRTLMLGVNNPMITGLSDFKLMSNLSETPQAIHTEILNSSKPLDKALYPAKIKATYQNGQKIAELKKKPISLIELCRELLKVFDV